MCVGLQLFLCHRSLQIRRGKTVFFSNSVIIVSKRNIIYIFLVSVTFVTIYFPSILHVQSLTTPI